MKKYLTIPALFFIGLALRIAFVKFVHYPRDFIVSDAANYVKLASSILQGEWHQYHFFQPVGYPLIMAIMMKFNSWEMSLGLLQVFLSSLTLYFVWKSASEIFDQKVAYWSLCLGTFHLPWIMFNGFAYSESIFTFLLSVLLWLSVRVVKSHGQDWKSSVLWGVAFFAAFLLKGNHVFLGPLFVAAIFYCFRNASFKKCILPICFTVGSFLLLHGTFAYSRLKDFK